MLFLGALSASPALLAACVQTRQEEPPLVVTARQDGDGCLVKVEGERVTSQRLLEIARRTSKRRAIVIFEKETPYKCTGGAIFTLQRAGIASVDAVAWDG